MFKKKDKTPSKIKVFWITSCPVCGKSHLNLWFVLKKEKTYIYETKCPQTKENFELKIYVDNL